MQAIATSMTQAMKEWTNVFPINVTENYTSSVTFMKQLTVVAISTVTFLKDFPDDSYTSEQFAGLKLKILKKRCRDEFADFISSTLMQAFEAFDKKYLGQLALCFYKGEFIKENLIEYYIFEYTYNKEGVSMNMYSEGRDNGPQSNSYSHSFEKVRESTLQLIRTCLMLTRSSPYSPQECRDVSIRLYYNENAPEGYNVSGFKVAGPAEDHLCAAGERATLGRVHTPFHGLRARTFFRDSLLDSQEAVPSQTPPIMTQADEDDFGDEQSPSPAVCTSEAGRVRCPCNRRDQDQHTAMLTCFYCNTRQHAACFGVHGPAGRGPHCCARCHDRDPRRAPTDARLAALADRRRECLCIYRRALQYCLVVPAVSAARVAAQLDISELNAAKLIRSLQGHGVVQQRAADWTKPLPINSEQLKAAISRYFHTPDDDIVDRLVAETFASQESTPDPVGNVLKPSEKVSLQNEDNLGRVIDNPVRPPVTEDSSLLEYREAVLLNYQQDDELPLSGPHNPVKDMENIGKKLEKRKLNDENERPRLRSSNKAKRAKKD